MGFENSPNEKDHTPRKDLSAPLSDLADIPGVHPIDTSWRDIERITEADSIYDISSEIATREIRWDSDVADSYHTIEPRVLYEQDTSPNVLSALSESATVTALEQTLELQLQDLDDGITEVTVAPSDDDDSLYSFGPGKSRVVIQSPDGVETYSADILIPQALVEFLGQNSTTIITSASTVLGTAVGNAIVAKVSDIFQKDGQKASEASQTKESILGQAGSSLGNVAYPIGEFVGTSLVSGQYQTFVVLSNGLVRPAIGTRSVSSGFLDNPSLRGLSTEPDRLAIIPK